MVYSDRNQCKHFRVGGDFELDLTTLTTSKLANANRYSLQYQYHFASGRSALSSLATYLRDHFAIKQVYLPVYACPSIVRALSGLKLTLTFYGSAPNLAFSSSLPQTLEDSLFFYIDYFGFPNKLITDFLVGLPKSNSFILQDCVQSCFSGVCFSQSDFVLHSFRKFTPIPDLATLESSIPLSFCYQQTDEQYVSQKLISKLIRSISDDDSLYMGMYQSAEMMLDLTPRNPSFVSNYLFDRLDFDSIAATRIKNWHEISQLIHSTSISSKAQPIFDTLPPEVVPLQYPIKVPADSRPDIRASLQRCNIYCPIHWKIDVHHSYESNFAKEIQLSHQILSLPVDQRIGEEYMSCYKDILSFVFLGL